MATRLIIAQTRFVEKSSFPCPSGGRGVSQAIVRCPMSGRKRGSERKNQAVPAANTRRAHVVGTPALTFPQLLLASHDQQHRYGKPLPLVGGRVGLGAATVSYSRINSTVPALSPRPCSDASRRFEKQLTHKPGLATITPFSAREGQLNWVMKPLSRDDRAGGVFSCPHTGATEWVHRRNSALGSARLPLEGIRASHPASVETEPCLPLLNANLRTVAGIRLLVRSQSNIVGANCDGARLRKPPKAACAAAPTWPSARSGVITPTAC